MSMTGSNGEDGNDGPSNRDLMWLLVGAVVAGLIIALAVYFGGGVDG